jgi:hypothetical protein
MARVTGPDVDDDVRAAMGRCTTIAVFPDRIPVSFTAVAGGARTDRVSSADRFAAAVVADGCGVTFHRITVAEGLARVAATFYLPGRPLPHAWTAVYRKTGAAWSRIEALPSPLTRAFVEPSLRPALDRNYGVDVPLKRVRLDAAMERVRVDFRERDILDRLGDGLTGGLDGADVALLEPYRRSDAVPVRYTAEYEVAKLTRQPDLAFWLRELANPPSMVYQGIAVEVIREFALRQIDREGRDAAGADRERLVAGTLQPRTLNPAMAPTQLPRPDQIRRVRRSSRFGLVDVSFGPSGYSLLFELRGAQWIPLFVSSGWIS